MDKNILDILNQVIDNLEMLSDDEEGDILNFHDLLCDQIKELKEIKVRLERAG